MSIDKQEDQVNAMNVSIPECTVFQFSCEVIHSKFLWHQIILEAGYCTLGVPWTKQSKLEGKLKGY